MITINKLAKAFNKMIQKEFLPDGYVCINKVEIYVDGTLIKISGRFGNYGTELEKHWSKPFELEYSDGKSIEFIKGMLYTKLWKEI